MEIKGRVIQSLPIESGTSKSGNQWQKASLIIEVAENPKYSKKIKLSTMRQASEFAAIPVGTVANFSIEIESREYNGRWYTEVGCWRWEVAQQQGQPQPQQQVSAPAVSTPQYTAPAAAVPVSGDVVDSLPF